VTVCIAATRDPTTGLDNQLKPYVTCSIPSEGVSRANIPSRRFKSRVASLFHNLRDGDTRSIADVIKPARNEWLATVAAKDLARSKS
jgi:hypothetical protein